MDNPPASTLRHIFYNGREILPEYAPARGGGGGTGPEPRDRINHANWLNTRLDTAWSSSEVVTNSRRAVSLPSRDGVYLEFSSFPDQGIPLTSLENNRSGIKLMSSRIVGDTTLATIFVPNSKRTFFLNKIRQYRDEVTPIKGEPKGRPLIDSIADIQRALVGSFWQDDPNLLPGNEEVKCEVWLAGDDDSVVTSFQATCDRLNIAYEEGLLHFPDRVVLVVNANFSHLAELIESVDFIAEFRRVKETARFFLELQNADQVEWVRDLKARLKVATDYDIAVCVLDTGVNNGHPLLAPLVADSDCLTFQSAWSKYDRQGHGTLMCGLAGYGDIQRALDTPGVVTVGHKIVSVKILNDHDPNDPKLYGLITAQAISLAEIQSPSSTQIICMAVTSDDGRDRGRPSSWSASIDKISSGAEDNRKRVLLVAAGNVLEADMQANYPAINRETSVHDPGQSWNALTIGAYTEKTAITDPLLEGHKPIAPVGGLSPYSSTSITWDDKWPIKPDVLFEGGNVALSPDGSDPFGCRDLSLVSTGSRHTLTLLDKMNMTSAATGLAANLAARLQLAYPHARPETIRALIVHSAEWSETIKANFLTGDKRTNYRGLLRSCGYGIPSERRAGECARNYLTLVAENEFQPYKLSEHKQGAMNGMALHELPWPKFALQELGESTVTIRVTLSYFVEPSPGERGWESRYRYPSHALRFDINKPTELRKEFITRVNKASRDEGYTPSEGASERWLIGPSVRDVGSIHSDYIVKLTGVEAAGCNLVAVYPVGGWWKDRPHLNGYDKYAEYSLIVSIASPITTIDIYTPVAQQVAVAVSQEIATEI